MQTTHIYGARNLKMEYLPQLSKISIIHPRSCDSHRLFLTANTSISDHNITALHFAYTSHHTTEIIFPSSLTPPSLLITSIPFSKTFHFLSFSPILLLIAYHPQSSLLPSSPTLVCIQSRSFTINNHLSVIHPGNKRFHLRSDAPIDIDSVSDSLLLIHPYTLRSWPPC